MASYGPEGAVFGGRDANRKSRKHSENEAPEERPRTAAAVRWLRLLSLAGLQDSMAPPTSYDT